MWHLLQKHNSKEVAAAMEGLNTQRWNCQGCKYPVKWECQEKYIAYLDVVS